MKARLPMPGVPEARQHPVLRRYPLRRLRVPCGGHQLSLVVPDHRAWLRSGTWAPAVVRGAEPPYWIRIWPAAVAVARRLARAADLSGLHVLDLGCGVGVPGVQAAALGASVTFVDREDHAVCFARWNAECQLLDPAPVVGRAGDWRSQTLPDGIDLMVLSDVTYHEQNHAPIRRHVERVLASGGVVLHADPCRELSSAFLSSLPRGWVRHVDQAVTAIGGQRARVRQTLLAGDARVLDDWLIRFRQASAGNAGSPAGATRSDAGSEVGA